MNLYKVGLTLLLFGACAFADDYADRVKLIGVWESQGTTGKSGVWSIKDDGENLHLVYSEGGQKVADFECNTVGKDCKTKVAGRESTVSLYFNGAKLVEMETRGPEILKRRFAAQGDQMEVDLIPISGAAKAETQQYKRSQVASAQSH